LEVVSTLDNAPQQPKTDTAEENPELKAAYMRFTFDGKETYSSIDK
jgi:hypothetical protein